MVRKAKRPKKDVEPPANYPKKKSDILTYLNENTDFKTILTKRTATVMITFRNMTLTVMKKTPKRTTLVLEQKYIMGDIGRQRYCREVQSYLRDGYDIVSEHDNVTEMFNHMKKHPNAFKS